MIPTSELFHGGEWDVDHILPRWRSLDDSQMNKVLVHRAANEEKGDQTPAEWFGENSEQLSQLLRRASALCKQNKLPYPKYKKLATRKLETDAFVQRQMNDTRYLSKLVVQYLSLLYPPEMRVGQKAIQTCKGGLTAELRRQWGLNSILPPLYNADGSAVLSDKTDSEGQPYKSRDDHRHHAIDAVVIAVSTRGFLKRYQDYWKKRSPKYSPQKEPAFPNPWREFRADVMEKATWINVSHRAMRKISGAFHEETFYGPARQRDGSFMADRYVTRKRLEDLTGKMVDNIRDKSIQALVKERLIACGWNGSDNSLPKEWTAEVLLMPSGVPIHKVRVEISIKNAAQLKHRYAILGNNHHMEILASEEPDSQGRPCDLKAIVVPTLQVADRVRRKGLPAIQRDHGQGRQLLMSLARKESVEVINPVTGECVICVVQKISGSPSASSGFDLYLRDVRDSRPASTGNKSPFKRLVSFNAWHDLRLKKVTVDPIGRVSPAND